MSDKLTVYIVVAVIVAHFLFAGAYLFYKIYRTPKKKDDDLKHKE